MTPNELFARKPLSVDKEINALFGYRYNHLPEIEELDYGTWIDEEKNDRVEIHCYQDFCFDGRRTWRLAGVKFDGEFVMIIQNAGRESDDHAERFITNRPLYDQMVEYVRSLLPEEAQEDLSADRVVDPDTEVEGLVEFYGHHLDGEFVRS